MEEASSPNSEMVSETEHDQLDIEAIRDPEYRNISIKSAEASARCALSSRRDAGVLGRGPDELREDEDAAYVEVFSAANTEMLAAQQRAHVAAKQVQDTNGDVAACEAFERAEFAWELAKAKVRAINSEEAERAHETRGDERKLAKLGKLGRRGRPRTISNEFLIKTVAGAVPAYATSRTRHNTWLQVKAIGALGINRTTQDPHRHALSEFYLGRVGEKMEYKIGALVELGRVVDKFGEAMARELADEIYEKYRKSNRRPRTQDIVAELRAWRMEAEGRKRSSGEDGLYRKMTRLIAEHRKLYPDMPTDEIHGVISRVQDDLFSEQQ